MPVAKNATFWLVISLFIVLTISCKKESAGGKASHKLRSYTEEITAVGVGRVVETFNINYDEQDRITSVVSATKPGHRLVYQYTNKDAFTFEKIEDDKVTLHSTYFINSSLSLVDSTYQYNNRKDTTSLKFFYNEDKKLVKEKEYIHSYLIPAPVLANVVNYQYDAKGTLNKKTESFSETTYRYDSLHTNTVQIQPFYFSVPEKLPTHTYATRFGATTTIEHTYTYDGSKRLISERAVSSNGSNGRITVKSYIYW